jgi:hypothetical protein
MVSPPAETGHFHANRHAGPPSGTTKHENGRRAWPTSGHGAQSWRFRRGGSVTTRGGFETRPAETNHFIVIKEQVIMSGGIKWDQLPWEKVIDKSARKSFPVNIS